MDKKIIGKYMAILGFTIFVLLFWCPFGFYLGGDPYFFGPFNNRLQVTFPYHGIGLFLLFIGTFLQGRFKHISEDRLLYFLIFLMFIGFLSNVSIEPNTSIVFLILWAIGFFAVVFDATFWANKRFKQLLMLIGILWGSIMSYYYPEWQISTDLLAIMSIYLMVFMKVSAKNLGEFFYIPLFFVITMSQNIGLIVFAGLIWMTITWWIGRRKKRQIDIWHWILFVIFIIITMVVYKRQYLVDQAWTMPLFSNWKIFFFGFGEGQLLKAFYNFSPVHIFSSIPTTATSGFMKTFFEQGILGILLIISLAINPLFFHRKKEIMPVILFLCFWILSADFLGTSNGILLAMLFLFMRKPKTNEA